MTPARMTPEQLELADAVRKACLVAALTAYEDAAANGLCHEGAWECAVDAIRGLDLIPVIKLVATEVPDQGR